MSILNLNKENLSFCLKVCFVGTLECLRSPLIFTTITAGIFSAWSIKEASDKNYYNTFTNKTALCSTALTTCLACSVLGVDKVISNIKKDPKVERLFKEMQLAENIAHLIGI